VMLLGNSPPNDAENPAERHTTEAHAIERDALEGECKYARKASGTVSMVNEIQNCTILEIHCSCLHGSSRGRFACLLALSITY
jgi:hypothetical protein